MHFNPVRYYFSADKQLYGAIKNIFGFYPGNMFLYKLAFLHKSVSVEVFHGMKINNERLEFLGDAILDAVTADYLFKTFPLKDEGFLTEMRSKIVSRIQLNKLAQKLGLNDLIQFDAASTGQLRSFQGDALEAFIGALYLDKGYRFTRKILLNRIIKNYFNINELVNQEMNFKSKILEWCQKQRKPIIFAVVDEIGSGYKKQYIVELQIDDVSIAQGQDYSIKGAEQLASEKGWTKLQEEQHGKESTS
ncbi:MAG: ribonuclease III [Bacteroidetes bacterium]|nr:ribonuclease III [Bacteroidota bacterium]